MTIRELLLMTGLYLAALIAVTYFTRSTLRRFIGAFAGGLAASLFGLGALVLFERVGLWHVPFDGSPYFLPLLYIGLAVSVMPLYLITWRLARRFGWKGLAIFIGIVAIIGPPRDYFYAATFPEWMVFSPGIAPVLADSAAYIGILLIGHAVMRLIAGPSLNRPPSG